MFTHMKKSLAFLLFPLVTVAVLAGSVWAESVTGTVTYRERIAVLPGLVLDVDLLDVSRADAASVQLSQRRYALKSVPASFELPYDPALIDDRMRYAVRASISDESGRLMWVTDASYPVLTQGASDTVDLVLVKMASDAAPSLEDSTWQVVELNGATVTAKRLPELSFADQGKFSAHTGCNTLGGNARVSGAKMSFPENMAMTMMACPPPYDQLEPDFVKALGQVDGFSLDGEFLLLTDVDGKVVMRLSPKPE